MRSNTCVAIDVHLKERAIAHNISFGKTLTEALLAKIADLEMGELAGKPSPGHQPGIRKVIDIEPRT